MGEHEQALSDAYWKLRQHASDYRSTQGFRRTYEHWRANRDDPNAYRKHVIHEFYARGLEAAAEVIAQMRRTPEPTSDDGGAQPGTG